MKYVLQYNSYLLEKRRWVSEIKQEDVPIVLDDIRTNLLDKLNLSEDSYSIIGSAGKLKQNDISYNINIAFDQNTLIENIELGEEDNNDNVGQMLNYLKNAIEELGHPCFIEDNLIMADWTVRQKKLKGVVEVRLQPTSNLKWLNFSRYSPNLNEDESEFRGKYREALLKSIVESLKKEIISYSNKNIVKEYKKYIFDINEGIYSVIKTFEGSNGYKKKAKVIESSKKLITNDPNEFTTMLFGENVSPDDIMTFEGVVKQLKSDEFPHKKKLNQIRERFKIHCKKYNLDVPENLY